MVFEGGFVTTALVFRTSASLLTLEAAGGGGAIWWKLGRVTAGK